MSGTTDRGSIWIAVVAMVPLGIYRGHVLSAMWRWFAVPLGAPPIGVVHAIGLAWLVLLVTDHLYRDGDEHYGELVLRSLITITSGWAFGFILQALLP